MSTGITLKVIVALALAGGAVTVLVYEHKKPVQVQQPLSRHQAEMLNSLKTIAPTKQEMK
jgi:hypothetical protein